MKCAYCGNEIEGKYSLITKEPLFPIGRFVNGGLQLLKKDDCVCDECLVARKPPTEVK